MAETGPGEASATDQRSELVYYRLPNSRPTRYLPATLRLADGGLSLTEPGGTPILSCALSDVSKVVIDHSTLHLHLPQGRIAVTLYPHAGSQAGGSAGRVLMSASSSMAGPTFATAGCGAGSARCGPAASPSGTATRCSFRG